MPPAPQPSQNDNSSGMLWTVAAIFVAIGAIWFGLKKYIVTFFLTIKLYEINFLELFGGVFNINPAFFEKLRTATTWAIANPTKITFNDLLNIGNTVGESLRYPFIAILFVLAVVVYFGNTARVYRRNYDMNELAKLEQVNWPQISPVINLNLLKTDIDKGPWAMAMTPMQFCKRHRLLQEVRPQRKEGMKREAWDRIDVVLKRGEANKIFALQLGQQWKGSQQLPPHIKGLFAVFAARINADSDKAAALIMQFSASAANKKLNMAGVDELLKKHENTKIVQNIVQSHAYVFTVMASMLAAAREDGVQASADFLWLKPLDRRLWYTLNTVGRQTPFIEVAGIFAHWLAEKEAGKKLLVPMVEEATNALEIALKEIVYKPDEEVSEG